MQVFEFSSVVDNEGVIHIPKEYLEKIASPAKIIILTEGTSNNKNKEFSALKLKTKGFKFDRDTAND